MKLVLASNNASKLREMREILAQLHNRSEKEKDQTDEGGDKDDA